MAMRASKVQPDKAEAIGDLKTQVGAAKDFIFAEYRGLTVEQITALRKQLREKKATFHVVKNNFARIAFEDLGYPKTVEPMLAGPTGVAFATEDSNEIAKVMVDFAKDVPNLKVKGGLIDKEFLDLAAIGAYSQVPGRKTLYGMFLVGLKSPVQKLAYTLVALREKLEKEGGAAAPAAAAPAAEAPAAPAQA